MAQVQTYEIRRFLEEFEDDQLQLTLELEAYERERVHGQIRRGETTVVDMMPQSNIG